VLAAAKQKNMDAPKPTVTTVSYSKYCNKLALLTSAAETRCFDGYTKNFFSNSSAYVVKHNGYSKQQ